MKAFWLCCLLGFSGLALAGDFETVQLQSLYVTVPGGWQVQQSHRDTDVAFYGFASGDHYVRLFVRRGSLDIKSLTVTNGATVTREPYVIQNGYAWNVIETRKGSLSIVTFCTKVGDFSYFGTTRSANLDTAREDANLFISFIR